MVTLVNNTYLHKVISIANPIAMRQDVDGASLLSGKKV